jgi:hypothetical protein
MSRPPKAKGSRRKSKNEKPLRARAKNGPLLKTATQLRGDVADQEAGEARKRRTVYDPELIADAPEFHELSRAMGTLTWDTWDQEARPVHERIQDFVFAYPPEDPVARMGGRLRRVEDGTYGPGDSELRLERFSTRSWSAGTLFELLARHGLKTVDAPPFEARTCEPGAFKEVARRRNIRLRVLHGGVDVEPTDMDAAKAQYLDKQEKQRAAVEIRLARKQMQEELSKKDR